MNTLRSLQKDSHLEQWAKSLFGVGVFLFCLATFKLALGASTYTFNLTVNAGTLSVDVVDASGVSVASPAVTFASVTTGFTVATSTGTLGTSSEKIRVSNPTQTATWSLTFAPTGTQALWFANGNTFGYKSADHSTGTMDVDPSTGTLAGVSGCSTSNVSLGSAGYFSPTSQSRTLASASSGAATFCQWDLTGVTIKQEVPSSQSSGSYQIGMTVTVS